MIYINIANSVLISYLGKYHSMIKTCCLKNFAIFLQAILSFVLSGKVLNICNNLARKYGIGTVKILLFYFLHFCHSGNVVRIKLRLHIWCNKSNKKKFHLLISGRLFGYLSIVTDRIRKKNFLWKTFNFKNGNKIKLIFWFRLVSADSTYQKAWGSLMQRSEKNLIFF